ncbi:MAG: GNAT family N-acetyltransferase [Kiloniellales bacterium]
MKPNTASRPLRPEDLDRVVEIDRRLVGRSRRGFFEKRLEAALSGADKVVAVAVEDGGTLVGYAIARIQFGAFGGVEQMAILDAVGVDPDHHGQGSGRRLMEGVIRGMKKLGVREIRTQVDWTDHGLMRFFAANGFALAPRLVFEHPTTREPGD